MHLPGRHIVCLPTSYLAGELVVGRRAGVGTSDELRGFQLFAIVGLKFKSSANTRSNFEALQSAYLQDYDAEIGRHVERYFYSTPCFRRSLLIAPV
jgi:hypothetical protein